MINYKILTLDPDLPKKKKWSLGSNHFHLGRAGNIGPEICVTNFLISAISSKQITQRKTV